MKRCAELDAQGRVLPAGRAALGAPHEDAHRDLLLRARKPAGLDAEQEARFRAVPEAWAFFSEVAPSYRRVATHRVVRAKRPETRERRLTQLIE